MSTIHQAQRAIQSLLGNSDFVGALDLISTTQEVLRQELQGLVSFRYKIVKKIFARLNCFLNVVFF